MNELIHADIFFFITSIAVVVITAALLVFLYHAIVIARDVRAIVSRALRVEKEIETDVEKVRTTLKEEGVKTKLVTDSVLGFIASIVLPRKRRVRHARPSSQH